MRDAYVLNLTYLALLIMSQGHDYSFKWGWKGRCAVKSGHSLPWPPTANTVHDQEITLN